MERTEVRLLYRRGEDAEAGGADGEGDARAGGVEFAVGVEQAGSGARDDEFFIAEMNHAAGAGEPASEETGE